MPINAPILWRSAGSTHAAYYNLGMDEVAIIVFLFLLGLAVGSFLNVVIYRLPIIIDARYGHRTNDLTLALPPSHCPLCKQGLKLRHNIPVVSWLSLGGRCAFCKGRISSRYPIVELLSAALVVGIYTLYGLSLPALAAVILAWGLICLAFIDAATRYLPDELTLGLMWCGLLVNAFSAFVHPADAIIGAIAGYASLWLIYMAFKYLTGKEGLGYGDMKLLAALGAFFGWQALPLIVLFASITGLAVSLVLIIVHKIKRHDQIPFGPYLAVGGLSYLLLSRILAWHGY